MAARRHATRYLELFGGAEAEAETRPTDEWLAIYGPRIDNVRAALDWAFSPSGDASLGVSLTIAAVPLWVQLSLLGECRERVERALASLSDADPASDRACMQLSAALGWSLMHASATLALPHWREGGGSAVAFRRRGRLCGVCNLGHLIGKRARILGFGVPISSDRYPEVRTWRAMQARSGRLRQHVHIIDGLSARHSGVACCLEVRIMGMNAGTGTIEPRRVFRERHPQGQGGRHRSDHVTLVEWPNRGTDHRAHARQASNVRP